MHSPVNLDDNDPYLARVRELSALFQLDPARAVEALKALSGRSLSAMMLLGWACEEGVGTARDPERAKVWYRQAAEKGSAKGYFYLGNLLQRERAYADAREAFEAAVAMGDARAHDVLSKLDAWQAKEQDYGPVRHAHSLLKTDPATAHREFQVLAERRSADAMYYLAWTYEKGTGTAVNLNEAERWYRRAFEVHADKAKKAEAAYRLAYLYEERADYAQALHLFGTAADLAYAPAQYHLGKIYRHGIGVDRQPERARSLFELAAAQGHLFAKREFAKLYLLGHSGLSGVPHGIRLFIRYLKELIKAVPKGGPDPQDKRFWG